MKNNVVFEPAVTYESLGNRSIHSIIDMIREGVQFKIFHKFMQLTAFSLPEWASFLHLSERTIQRYQTEDRPFDPLQSERIIDIALLYKKGFEVFGNTEAFNSWMAIDSIALGNIKPKSLLDNSFGIQVLKDELGRIEHGVLA